MLEDTFAGIDIKNICHASRDKFRYRPVVPDAGAAAIDR
jgi:hypothetical protein